MAFPLFTGVVDCVVLYVVLGIVIFIMSKLGYYVAAMRLRTLPLSLAGVSLGLMLAASDYIVRWDVVLFTVLTALFLQILSNVSNELGDALRGTDSGDRQGPAYSISAGRLGIRDFKFMVWVYAVLSALSGLALIKCSYGTLLSLESVLFMILGFAAISSAMRYTLGKSPYGYRGMGDVYVFIFFGIVSVLGSYLIAAHDIPSWFLLLSASAIGFFSMAVLNVNNIRDMSTDAATRMTVPLKIGEKGAKVYQTVLIVLGWAAMLGYAFSRVFSLWHYLFVLTLPLFVLHVAGVWRGHGRSLDPMLPLLVISTFLFALLGGLGFIVFLF